MNNDALSSATPPKPKVAFLGEANDRSTFGAKAAEHFFGNERVDTTEGTWDFIAKPDHTAILDALWNREVDYGIVAIENAVDGVVNESARGVARLTARGIHVLEEVVLPITFYFVANGDLDLTKEITIYAHPVAKGQCLRLKRRIEQLAKVASKKDGTVKFQNPGKDNSPGSNNAAARKAAEGDNCAAITTWEGMKGNGLRIVNLTSAQLSADNPAEQSSLNLLPFDQKLEDSRRFEIGDFENSITRFWKLGHGQFEPSGEYKDELVELVDKITGKKTAKKRRFSYNRTSILLNLDHDSPGGLTDALGYFSRHKCNLSLVYPIPIPGRQFEYSFMLEYEDSVENGKIVAGGHIDAPDGKLRAAYDELLNSGISLNPPTIFGAYRTEILGAYTGTVMQSS